MLIFIENDLDLIVDPFHVTGLFPYLLKKIRKPEVFLCFQGVLKETNGMEWVDGMEGKL